ncbi:MAG: PEP-CTERM sorting domain-containing protein [Terriglobales bacterium]
MRKTVLLPVVVALLAGVALADTLVVTGSTSNTQGLSTSFYQRSCDTGGICQLHALTAGSTTVGFGTTLHWTLPTNAVIDSAALSFTVSGDSPLPTTTSSYWGANESSYQSCTIPGVPSTCTTVYLSSSEGSLSTTGVQSGSLLSIQAGAVTAVYGTSLSGRSVGNYDLISLGLGSYLAGGELVLNFDHQLGQRATIVDYGVNDWVITDSSTSGTVYADATLTLDYKVPSTTAPEPSTLTLLAAGLVGLLGRKHR